ncbi:MAG: M3 family metallopeptidase [Deltaproteobacteria bacterium]|nr:M3 family metallopeptidase [Deltaproteobacteria bacterium]
MRSIRRCVVAMLSIACLPGCAAPQARPEPTPQAAMSTPPPASATASASASATPAAPGQVLLQPWTGPYGGVPPFGRFTLADFKPALEAGIAENLAEVERIAADPSPPTFDNTIVALERAGMGLKRANAVYDIYTGAMSDDAMQALEREMAPKLAALSDAIVQNTRLFKRIAAVYDARAQLKLTPEQQRLLWLDYTGFVRSGAKLDDASKKKLSELNQRLAELYTKFGQNVLAEEGSQMVLLESEADLAGLPPSLREAAAAAAANRGKSGRWVIANTRSSVDPFLTYSTRRDLREKVWRMFKSRGDNRDAHDNNETIAEILKLRAQRATLLGYKTHAHWQIEQSMAKTPERAMELMEAVWKPAVARVKQEVADMQAIAGKERPAVRIAAWDYLHYAEKVRKAKYDLDQNEVKPYLQLEKLREGMFWVAGELFGFQFKQITDGSVAVYHPDVRVWQVTDAQNKHIGLWFFDPYARKGKRSGAWMNEYRPQSRVDGDVPVIVSNNANFVKGKPNEPILISWDDARTLFHEFGHALHGLNSNVTYPTLAGTSVARDYVEFPSQLLEHWVSTREVLDKYALHATTGQPMPAELVAKIKKAATFNQGYSTVEALSAALIDMKLHLAGDKPIDPRAFEKDTLAALGMPAELVMRHRTPHFNHVFSGDGYSAGYYSYLWSDTISADAWEAFVEAGGPYDKAVARKLHDNVFAVGNTIDPADGYRLFRGRDAGIDALLRKRGFPLPRAAAPKRK